MPTLTPDTFHMAAKEHRCFFCGETIEKGTDYIKRSGIEDGKFWRIRMHPECQKATEHWMEYEYENFDEGSLVRGKDEVK